MAAGLDSLAVVELRSRVEAAFGVALPATVALDYPTLKASLLWLHRGADCGNECPHDQQPPIENSAAGKVLRRESV